jgi:hypothetical protein
MSFIDPLVYRNRVNTLKSQLTGILDSYVENYVRYNQDTSINANKNFYDTSVSNLNTLNTDLLHVKNEVDVGIADINTLLTDYDSDIETEKTTNIDLKNKLGIVQNEHSGSNEMVHDFKNMYNLQYLNNFAIFGGLLAVLSLLFKSNKINAGPVYS